MKDTRAAARRLACCLVVSALLISVVGTPMASAAPGTIDVARLQKLAQETRQAFKSDNLENTQGASWHAKYGYETIINLDTFLPGVSSPDPVQQAKDENRRLKDAADAKSEETGEPIDWAEDIHLPMAEYLMLKKGTVPSIGDFMYANCAEMCAFVFEELYRIEEGLEIATANVPGVDHTVLVVRPVGDNTQIYIVDAWWHDGVVIGPCKWINNTIDCTGAKGADPKYHAPLIAHIEGHWIKTKGGSKSRRNKGRTK